MAKWLGAPRLVVPSAGNAGAALAAYAARAGLEAHVFMPADTPSVNVMETRVCGGKVTLVQGLINDCAAKIQGQKRSDWFDISTLKEPYRVEGKKTLGYEIAEQLGWRLPEVIIYPTGGGTGLVGMWKAFSEMEVLGWISAARPRMIAVQAAGCQPIVRAFTRGQTFAEEHQNAETVASGLRVPKAIGDFLILRAIQQSKGTAIAVSDEAMMRMAELLAAEEGLFVAPETGACLAALEVLAQQGSIGKDESVVIFNTGTGLKYLEAFAGGRPLRDSRNSRVPSLPVPASPLSP
jgi:threonine synthase